MILTETQRQVAAIIDDHYTALRERGAKVMIGNVINDFVRLGLIHEERADYFTLIWKVYDSEKGKGQWIEMEIPK
jgi:hypothetical protein